MNIWIEKQKRGYYSTDGALEEPWIFELDNSKKEVIYWRIEPAWTNHLLEETTKHCDDDLDIILRGAWKITFSCIFFGI